MSSQNSPEDQMSSQRSTPESIDSVKSQAVFSGNSMLAAYDEIFRPHSHSHNSSIGSTRTAATSMYEESSRQHEHGRENTSARAPLLGVSPLHTKESNDISEPGKSIIPTKVKDWPERPQHLRKLNAKWAFWTMIDVVMTILPFSFLGDLSVLYC